MKRKAIFFDIDGTIFEPGKSNISEPVINAIHQVQSLGHLCFVASGRPYTSLPDFITQIGFDGMICGNGTQISLHNHLISEKCLDIQKSIQIIHFIEHLNLEYILLTTAQSCISKNHQELFEYYKQYSIDLDAILIDYHLDDLLPHITKIETMTHTHQERESIKEFAEQLGFFVEIKKDGYIELSDKQITKGTALIDMCKIVQIPISDSIVFGDGLNDLDMFHAAGHCIAMGNAVNELKEIADEITLDVSEDGVAYALNQYFDF